MCLPLREQARSHKIRLAYLQKEPSRLSGRLAVDVDLGTPSLGEVPSGGAGALWLLSRFSKVTRRKGETISGRYKKTDIHTDPDSAVSADIPITDPALSRASSLPQGIISHREGFIGLRGRVAR